MNESYKKVAIVQSNYIPWRGYFDLIASVDEFIFLDDVQFTKRDWRNRNQIRTSTGPKWLTVPVKTKGKFFQKICETKISNQEWQNLHWALIEKNYCKANYFEEVSAFLKPVYTNHNWTSLSQLNRALIEKVLNYLKVDTKLSWSWEYNCTGSKSEKLLNIVKSSNANIYVSGPAAKCYLDIKLFQKSGLEVKWFNYDNLKSYPQIGEDFISKISIIDLIMNVGKKSIEFLPNAQ